MIEFWIMAESKLARQKILDQRKIYYDLLDFAENLTG